MGVVTVIGSNRFSQKLILVIVDSFSLFCGADWQLQRICLSIHI